MVHPDFVPITISVYVSVTIPIYVVIPNICPAVWRWLWPRIRRAAKRVFPPRKD